MCRRFPLARRRAPVTPEPCADQMVLGEKALEIFMRRTYIIHD
jgi:hypothetical protein